MTEEAIKNSTKKKERGGEREQHSQSKDIHQIANNKQQQTTQSHHEHPHQNFGHTILHRGRSRTPTQPRHRNSHYARAHNEDQHNKAKRYQPRGHNDNTPSPASQANPTSFITVINPTNTPSPTSQAPKETQIRMHGRGKGHSPDRPGGMA